MPANDTMTYGSTTWDLLEEKHGIQELPRRILFDGIAPVEPSPALVMHFQRVRHTRLVNERARAHRLVDPVLVELENLRPGQISTVPEVKLNVKGMEGLSGVPEFIISGSTTHKLIPIVAIIEAKKEDVESALPQCVAELYAAYLLNGGKPARIYGCVTTGIEWQFLALEGAARTTHVDVDLYQLADLPRLLGVLCHILDTTLPAMRGAS